MARWSMTGRCFCPSCPHNSSPKRSGIRKNSKLDGFRHCHHAPERVLYVIVLSWVRKRRLARIQWCFCPWPPVPRPTPFGRFPHLVGTDGLARRVTIEMGHPGTRTGRTPLRRDRSASSPPIQSVPACRTLWRIVLGDCRTRKSPCQDAGFFMRCTEPHLGVFKEILGRNEGRFLYTSRHPGAIHGFPRHRLFSSMAVKYMFFPCMIPVPRRCHKSSLRMTGVLISR